MNSTLLKTKQFSTARISYTLLSPYREYVWDHILFFSPTVRYLAKLGGVGGGGVRIKESSADRFRFSASIFVAAAGESSVNGHTVIEHFS